ncbi:MAG: DNA mismatch repair protein MutS [Candidatus Omnitrophica bacterium]|nr:DNA mismatch repair protein MutS [Candidatus Omnitrophota bacterium]
MMAQYRRIKSELPRDALLLFRLGDFYEMFFEDAIAGAQLLNVALTKRGTAPMCGIPYHAAHSYISRILRAGRKVAICDQMEEARPGQLVKREVTRILSPGTHLDERMLQAERNNFLASVYPLGGIYGLAFVDLTTGDFTTTEVEGNSALLTELERRRPAEIIYPGESGSLRDLLQPAFPVLCGYDDWVFAPETALFTVRDHFRVASLDGFGLKDRTAAVGATGGVLHYLSQHLHRDVTHLNRLSFYLCSDFLGLDGVSLNNLEILEPLHRDAPPPGSLYGALNRTVTPMGARRLRDWLSQPLAAVEPIRQRQQAVKDWIDHPEALELFRRRLSQVRDLERTITRLSAATGNARDLGALRLALAELPALQKILQDLAAPSATLQAGPLQEEFFENGSRAGHEKPVASTGSAVQSSRSQAATGPSLLRDLAAHVTPMPELVELIGRAIVDDPPLAIKEGGLIRDGFNSSLDELRRATREGKDWIARLQQEECDRTGIPSLKVRFNSVFGYYIEITRAHLDKVPGHYVRKQTIANGERFVTPELKEMEGRILGAQERAAQCEYDLFLEVRETVIGHLTEIQQTARALAQLDVLAAFAETARLYDYCRPEVGDEGILRIRDGRHPVLDQVQGAERFVPNDTELDLATQQIALITGPNMAGKSTYLRQVALLVILAHAGSFLPAAEARIDLVDRVFTRIGASDNIARGQSTFMVEMSETANLLNNASPASLVVLDEIGRGTSTFDGLSLAWSIVEHLHNQVGTKTLFATHYHELTELAARLPRLRNFNVAVREWNDQVIFLRKIVPGGTDKSYGIQVARLAGVPQTVIERAKVILSNLEQAELTPEGNVRPQARQRAEREKLKNLPPSPQLDLF